MAYRNKFLPNTAGEKMISNVPRAKVGQTVAEIKDMLIRTAKKYKTLDYVYVLNGRDILRGVASIKEILQFSGRDMKIDKIMKRDMVVAHPYTNQERVAYLALRNSIKTVPVVDKDGRLMGVVPHDTILQIFNEEAHEDIFSFAGIHHVVEDKHTEGELQSSKTTPVAMVKARLPWLIVGLMGGVIAASVVGVFEGVLNTYIALAMFMPVLVYMSDAVGTQSETLIVRNMALNPKFSVRLYIVREFKVAVVLAAVCGGVMALASGFTLGTYAFSVVIGVSMAISIIMAVLIATFLPLVLSRFRLDPAVVAGPFGTVVTDILTLAVYFTVATLLLSFV